MKNIISLLGIMLFMVSCDQDPASAIECAGLVTTADEKAATFEDTPDSTSCSNLAAAIQALVDNSCSVLDTDSTAVEVTADDVAEIQGACEEFNSDGDGAGEEVPITTDNLLGTWELVAQEMGQHITTNVDQTTIPLMGHIMGIAPFVGGFTASGDIEETFNHMMPMGMGGFVNKSILEMGMMDMEDDSTSAVIDICMLMLHGENDEDYDMEYNCELACGDLNADGPSVMYVGNVDLEVMELDSTMSPDASSPFMSIVGTATLTYINFETEELDDSRIVTLSGSVSFIENTVAANTPTDLMELQMGVSMEDLMALIEMDDMMDDVDMSVTFNADGTYSTVNEFIEYEMDYYTGEETEMLVTYTCNGNWSEDDTYGLILSDEECDEEDDEEEDEDWNSSDDGMEFIVTDLGYLIVTQSSDSFCDLDGGFGFGPYDYYDYYDYDGEDDENEGDDEEECRESLEEMLAFDEGSLETAYIYMSMILSQGGSRKMIANIQNDIGYNAMLSAVRRHNMSKLPSWKLN